MDQGEVTQWPTFVVKKTSGTFKCESAADPAGSSSGTPECQGHPPVLPSDQCP